MTFYSVIETVAYLKFEGRLRLGERQIGGRPAELNRDTVIALRASRRSGLLRNWIGVPVVLASLVAAGIAVEAGQADMTTPTATLPGATTVTSTGTTADAVTSVPATTGPAATTTPATSTGTSPAATTTETSTVRSTSTVPSTSTPGVLPVGRPLTGACLLVGA